MNMTALGGENMTPNLDEDDPARRYLLVKIKEIHANAITDVLDSKYDNVKSLGYLRKRVRYLTYASLMLKNQRISAKKYKEFAQMQNGDILYSKDFQDNFDVQDTAGKSISQRLEENSTW